jgi:hypothetical protein
MVSLPPREVSRDKAKVKALVGPMLALAVAALYYDTVLAGEYVDRRAAIVANILTLDRERITDTIIVDFIFHSMWSTEDDLTRLPGTSIAEGVYAFRWSSPLAIGSVGLPNDRINRELRGVLDRYLATIDVTYSYSTEANVLSVTLPEIGLAAIRDQSSYTILLQIYGSPERVLRRMNEFEGRECIFDIGLSEDGEITWAILFFDNDIPSAIAFACSELYVPYILGINNGFAEAEAPVWSTLPYVWLTELAVQVLYQLPAFGLDAPLSREDVRAAFRSSSLGEN